MNKYLCFDTETGGIGLDKSLLTAYLAVYDDSFNAVDELSLLLKPDDGIYRVEARALEINGINLVEHDKLAIPYREAKHFLYNFLFKNSIKGDKLVPVGHGVAFDTQRLKHDLISSGSWENFVSYRAIDTSNVARFLIAAGKIPATVSGSLESLCDYFKVTLAHGEQFHSANVDTQKTFAVFYYMLQMIKGPL
jgi:DNA polymerase III alpha subunit (gram-positive type)